MGDTGSDEQQQQQDEQALPFPRLIELAARVLLRLKPTEMVAAFHQLSHDLQEMLVQILSQESSVTDDIAGFLLLPEAKIARFSRSLSANTVDTVIGDEEISLEDATFLDEKPSKEVRRFTSDLNYRTLDSALLGHFQTRPSSSSASFPARR